MASILSLAKPGCSWTPDRHQLLSVPSSGTFGRRRVGSEMSQQTGSRLLILIKISDGLSWIVLSFTSVYWQSGRRPIALQSSVGTRPSGQAVLTMR
jgi:hypothetical protein